MFKKLIMSILLIIVCLLMGCSLYETWFTPPFKLETNVIMKENDFELKERNLEGSYSCWFIYIWWPYPPTYLPIPLGDPRLFSNALANMYSMSKEQAEEKSTQLVNWTLDQDMLFIPIPIIAPVKRTAKFRADLMEFQK